MVDGSALLRLVHLSDLHHQIDWRKRSLWSSGWRGAPGRFELHALGRLRRFAGVERRIVRLVEQVLALTPDRVILTGDLTALGEASELRHARALLEPFIAAGLLVVVPGNHDRYTDARSSAFELVFADLLTSDLAELADARGYPFVKLVGERHALVGLDSTRVQGWSHYLVGRLGASQLRALARVLEHPALHKRTVLLLAHHGPAGPSGAFDWNESGLIDAAALLRTIRHARWCSSTGTRTTATGTGPARRAHSSPAQLHRARRVLGSAGGRSPRAGGGGPPAPLSGQGFRRAACASLALSEGKREHLLCLAGPDELSE
jgi:hypothetical protein